MTEPIIMNPLGEATGAEAQYQRFLAEALAIPAEQLIPYRVNPLLAYHNSRAGVSTVLKHEAELPLSAEKLAMLQTIPDVALALAFAARQVNTEKQSEGEIRAKLGRAYEIRDILLQAAEVCARAGLISFADVERIKRGKGPIDGAQDCIDLAALYRREAATLVGRTPATPELIHEAAELGTELVKRLRPANAPEAEPQAETPSALAAALDIRNRFWTMLSQRHEELWKVGAALFGKAVDEFVPPLQSRQLERKKDDKEERDEDAAELPRAPWER
jgi:hypothetical protein